VSFSKFIHKRGGGDDTEDFRVIGEIEKSLEL
jgi:hypothetical protein